MKIIVEKVTSNKVPVGKIEIPQYDSVDEAVKELGAEKVLKLVNTQHATDYKNNCRRLATSKPSKADAQAEIMTSLTDDEFNSVRGDKAKLATLLETKLAQYYADWEAKRQANAAQVAAEDGDEDDSTT